MREDSMTGFWRNWLTIWAWGVVGFGLLLAAGGFAATDGAARLLLANFYSGGVVVWGEPLHFAVGLMGALTIGLGLLVMAAARAADALGAQGRPIWMMTLQALTVWYVIDSSISCANGFTINAISNTLLLATFLAPLLASGVLKAQAPARA
jgi:hypothetical protein